MLLRISWTLGCQQIVVGLPTFKTSQNKHAQRQLIEVESNPTARGGRKSFEFLKNNNNVFFLNMRSEI